MRYDVKMSPAKAQRRKAQKWKGTKKAQRNAAALCAFAPLRENICARSCRRRPLVYSLFWSVLLSGVVSFTTSPIAAQSPAGSNAAASLSVKVTDPSGAVIVNAKATLKGAKGPVQTAETDKNGRASFANVAPGKYHLQVEANGFQGIELKDVTIKPGNNALELNLEIAEIKEEVVVSTDRRESMTNPEGPAFTTILTQEQIANLPDDPEELDQVLREMAGPGAVVRVNGFSGGRLPPKSQIREIRFKLNPYAAENHQPGLVSVDILTRPGSDNWHGTFNVGFRDESLAARNAFAPVRGPEQYRRFGLTLEGPLLAKRTSLFLTGEGSLSLDSKTIVAALPQGEFQALARVPARFLNLSARVEHVLTKYHTLRAEYQRNASAQNNLGVGNFDLPERAFSSHQVENLLRFSDTGPFYKRFVNEVRFQMRWQDVAIEPANLTPSIQVLNAFNAGGAQANSLRQIRQFEFVDNLDFAVAKHAMKVGVLVEGHHETTDERRNAQGTFLFSSLDDFTASQPVTFTRRIGAGPISFSVYRFGGFWQDDLRLHKSLTVSLGGRFDFQTNVEDNFNFAPRVGVVWSPFANGLTTIRAGAGIFYDWFDTDTYLQTLLVDGVHQQDLVIRNPGFPNPFNGSEVQVLPPSRITLEPQLNLPYVEQWSLGLERQIAKKFMLRANYLYQRGVHLIRGHNINAPFFGSLRPDPAFGNINQVESTANSSLNSVNINFSPQALRSTRVFWIVNYTWSKAENETDSPLGLPANNFDLRAERGPSLTDSRHRLLVIANFKILNPLRLGTILRAGSATPFNITTGFDDNGDTSVNDRPAGVGRNNARGAAQWDLSARLSWTIGFGKIGQKSDGGQPTVIRSSNSGDALGALSSLGNDSRYGMQFYLQVFNLFNHANLINFTGVQTSPFFGQATTALPGRRLEVGLRFTF